MQTLITKAAKLLLTVIVSGYTLSTYAAGEENNTSTSRGWFNHMDVGVNISSTGIGADLALPMGKSLRLRTGFTYMPQFHLHSDFAVSMNSDISSDKKRRMMDLMKNFTGKSMDDYVTMEMTPKWWNFKLLVDIMPFRNHKEWYATVGFYYGPAKIGEAVNVESSNNTVLAVNVYNALYKRAYTGEPMFTYEDSSGEMHSFDLSSDLTESIFEAGMMGMKLGEFEDGDCALMTPDENNVARAELEVNNFRPYLGVGYCTPITRDHKLNLKADVGVMFWGGTPHVYVDNVYKVNNDYDIGDFNDDWEFVENSPMRIDLAHDVNNINGKVGDWVRRIKKFKCYPIVSVTFAYNVF